MLAKGLSEKYVAITSSGNLDEDMDNKGDVRNNIENGVITDNKENMEVTKKEIATTYTYEKTAD
jgi:hypothetical protein